MKVSYTRQFVNDIEKNPQLKRKVFDIIETFKNAKTLSELKNIKKLKSSGNDFRYKLAVIESDLLFLKVQFFLNDFYIEKIFTGFSPDSFLDFFNVKTSKPKIMT